MITSLNNFTGVTLETDVLVITLKDNLTHAYCSKISWEKDNIMPMGVAKITMPYSQSIEKYWSTYNGAVVIHANLNNKKEKPKLTTQPKKATSKIKSEKDKEKIRIQNDEYNYSFIGKVHKIKQTGKQFTIYLEDLGWKFLQKVPNDFRQTYIAGQTLDNAFQAICEFMGVDFAYSIEDLSALNFAADGYSIEKDGTIIEDTPSIFDDFTKTNEEEDEEEKTEDEKMGNAIQGDQPFEASGLIEYKKQQKQEEKNNQANNQTNNQALNQTTTNSTNETTPEEETPEENSKIEEYQEEFDEKIKDLFKGNTLYDSNISDPILNYDWITIEPTPITNTSQSTGSSSTPSGNSTENTEDEASNQQSSSSSPSTSFNGIKGSWGKTSAGGYYLTQDAINKMSMAEAKRRYEYGKAHEPYYTRATMEKLFWRMMFGTKFF